MKKFFLLIPLLFFFFLFSSCGDDNDGGEPPLPSNWKGDWNDPSDPNYKSGGYNPIEGEWLVTQKNGSVFEDFILNKFTDKFMWRQCLLEPEDGKAPVYITGAEYMINNEAFMNKINKTIITYRFNSDSTLLYITEKSDNYTMTRYEKWDGDIVNYNPIEGEWLLKTENNSPAVYFRIFHFSDKKVWLQSQTYPILGSDFSYMSRGEYGINKTQFKAGGKVYNYTSGVNLITGNDDLMISYNNTTWVLEPYNSDVWKDWKGNWNEPSDSNYKPEGYNPIVGKWRLVLFDKKNWIGDKTIYSFSEDFKWMQSVYTDSGKLQSENTSHYIINDKAYNSGSIINQYTLTEEAGNKKLILTTPAMNQLTFDFYTE